MDNIWSSDDVKLEINGTNYTDDLVGDVAFFVWEPGYDEPYENDTPESKVRITVRIDSPLHELLQGLQEDGEGGGLRLVHRPTRRKFSMGRFWFDEPRGLGRTTRRYVLNAAMPEEMNED